MKSRASSLLIGIWQLMTVLANAYAGTLLSFLSVAKLKPVINSLDELAETNKYPLITMSHIHLVDYLMVYTFTLSLIT